MYIARLGKQGGSKCWMEGDLALSFACTIIVGVVCDNCVHLHDSVNMEVTNVCVGKGGGGSDNISYKLQETKTNNTIPIERERAEGGR